LETSGERGSITVAESTYEEIKDKFRFQGKRTVDIRGHGTVTVYELGGRFSPEDRKPCRPPASVEVESDCS